MLLREFVSVDIFSPGWISVRLLAWLSAVAAAAAATLMWLNLDGFPDALRRGRGAALHVRRRRDDGCPRSCCSASRSRTIPSAGAAAGSARRCSSSRSPARWRCRSPPAAPAARCRSARGASRLQSAAGAVDPRTSRCCSSTARRSSTCCRASRRDGCRISAACSTAARRWTWRRSVRRSPIRCGRRSRPGMYPAKNGVRSAAAYFARGDDLGLDLLPGSLLLAHPRASRRRPRRAEFLGRLARPSAVDHPRGLRPQRPASSAGR